MAVFVGGTTAANQFDDYEEGQWTPVLQAFDVGSSNTWTDATYDDALDYTSARYTKVGRLVQVWWYSGAFSLSGNHNNRIARINGLPFPFVNNDPYYGGMFNFTHATCFKDTSQNSTAVYTGYGVYNQTYFYPNEGNTTEAARWGSESGRYLMFSGCYQTNNT